MNQTLSSALHLAALMALLSGCAGQRAFRDGQALLDEGKLEQGLARLEQAVQAEPGNAEYRIALLNRRMRLANASNGSAQAARQRDDTDAARAHYQQALAIDPGNAMAHAGLTELEQDRRYRRIVADAQALFERGDDAATLAQTQEALRAVLVERPYHPQALALRARVSELQARQKAGSGRLAAGYRQPVTLEFRDAPLRAVFDFLGKAAGLNFVFDRDVDPNLRTTIVLRDTSIEAAIALLLGANQLEQSVADDRSVTIYPNTAQKNKDYQTLVVRSFYLNNADVKNVAFGLKTLLKARDLVTDERLGLLIMRDTPDMVRMAERLIAVQDLADPEVMLEVEVLEVSHTRLMELGVQWPQQATLSLDGQSGASLGKLKIEDLRHINGRNITLGLGGTTLNAYHNNGDSNLLANPRIRVRNKEKAKVLIGNRVPVITVTTNNGVSSDNVNYLDVGLKLDVEPTVHLDDEVAIKINLEVSNLVKEVTSKTGTLAYQIGTRSANTVLRLRNGETQVLAGLINNEERTSANKVPGLGQLPILNRLFGTQKDDGSRSEIVLAITPRILRSILRPDRMAAEFDSGTENSIGRHAAHGAALTDAPAPAAAPATQPVPGSGATAPPPQPATGDGVPKRNWPGASGAIAPKGTRP